MYPLPWQVGSRSRAPLLLLLLPPGLLQGEPRALRDSLGGDLMVSVLAAINFPSPVPAMRAAGMHGHVFLNGGNCLLLGGSGRSLHECWQDFTSTFRWSVVSQVSSLGVCLGGECSACVCVWR